MASSSAPPSRAAWRRSENGPVEGTDRRQSGEWPLSPGTARPDFIDVLTKWKEVFVAGVHLPVMGVTEAELASIKVPTIVIPGNDKAHSSESGLAAHRLITGCTLHRLPSRTRTCL